NDFSMISLISKSSAAGWSAEGWYGIQSINGVTVLLDEDVEEPSSGGRGYSGTTEEVATYRRETISVVATQTVQDSGAEGSPITFSGGWNASSGLQDGMTFFDLRGRSSAGVTVDTREFLHLERLGAVRGSIGVFLSSSPNCTVTECSVNNNSSGSGGIFLSSSPNSTVTECSVNNNNSSSGGGISLSTSSNCTVTECSVNNNNGAGINLNSSSGGNVSGVECSNNGTYGLSVAS